MIKVLNIITTGFSFSGGLSTVALNYYNQISEEECHIDFLSVNDISQELLEQLAKKNSRYFVVKNRRKNPLFYMWQVYRVLIREKYDVVHVHGNSSTMTFELLPAKLAKVKNKIAHVHSAKSDFGLLHKLLNPLFQHLYDVAIAVSNQSGDWLFNDKNYFVLNNAIDLLHYSFNESLRKNIREKYGITDEFVIGSVGKFTPSKNQLQLLEIFAEYHRINQNSKLMLVGDGDLRKQLEMLVAEKELEDVVIFTGLVDDVRPYYQAMDFFLFTSKFEGFGLVLVEAQATGLKCLCSDKVPNLTNVSDSISYLSLDQDVEVWAKNIDVNDAENRKIKALNNQQSITENHFNIKVEYKSLLDIYKNSI